MYLINPQLQSRRAFLRRAGHLAFTGTALPTALNLAAIGEAAAFNAGNDYKALVCIFLYGGNDYANTVIPFDDSNYNKYSAIRGGAAGQIAGGIALGKLSSALDTSTTQAALTALAPTNAITSAIGETGLQYAFLPSYTRKNADSTVTTLPCMSDITTLFNGGKIASVLSCGPLIKPTSKTQYYSGNHQLPPKLFSHNDQVSVWQSSSPEGSTKGWGGSIGDLAMASNGTNSLFTCISVTGNAVFLSGNTALSYQVGSAGAVKTYAIGDNAYPYGFQAVGTAMKNLTTGLGRSHVLENEYNRVTKRSVDAEVAISAAIATSAPTKNVYPAPFDKFPSDNPLATQLRMVARLIQARASLGTKRQVYMVSLGGCDLHDNLINGHIKNMGRLNTAMKAFYDATVAMGISDKVTTFTASDFGRTLTSNGDGSDHGWGGHHFVMGDAVNGNNFYGYAPPVSVGSSTDIADQWHVGQGRLLPTTSVEQYAGTIAKWFGVESGDMAKILPNLKNFNGSQLTVGGTTLTYASDLGFMKAA